MFTFEITLTVNAYRSLTRKKKNQVERQGNNYP